MSKHIIDASEEVGVDATLSHAAQSMWRRAIDASDERGEIVSSYRLIRGDRSGDAVRYALDKARATTVTTTNTYTGSKCSKCV
ncbi:putative dehydrogenase [Mycobacteroides abscessus subsp. massiliense]|nr:putative dehydrogenase [Mycobacteroides abscessus subsp. massiliense]SKY94513.1 putative dehydrogenase [Mycobacteroides abscessus subsp. massiliense]